MRDLTDRIGHPNHQYKHTEKIEINLRLGTLIGCVFLGCCILVAALIVYAPDTGLPIALAILDAVKTIGWILLYAILALILCAVLIVALIIVAHFVSDW